ncbi:MAG TPA: alpha-glucan family phosphorylase [Candidatus Sulfotelmatobacter sp.]|jgi:starch phosphorylase|nr:alpha-glucan family phosphorylase [Candidatus Sulfotelmatobacter sp.]
MTDQLWFKEFKASKECTFIKDRPIVYFCAEYALHNSLPLYAGGLGILAGDMIREAAEQEIPFIAVGLYYHQGYISHDLYPDGINVKSSGPTNPEKANLTPVVDKQNNRIIVTVPIQDSLVFVQAWSLQMGSVQIYFLDTNIPQNEEGNKQITDQLYASSKETRFKQEIVLGLGGLRLLEALQISPMGYHLNEGHSALLTLEIARHEMQKHKRTFAEEIANTKKHIFFTNHTLIPAGNDTFNADLVSVLLSGFAKELQVPVNEIIKLGLVAGSSMFSMALLALRMAGKINAVSRLHAKKAQEIWKEYPMIPITNGIHIKTWDFIKNKENIWEKHQDNKKALLTYIHKMTGETWDENTLLLGWARRIVEYKRPLALFENLQKFKDIATTSNRQIRVVISGLSHENDVTGLALLTKIQKIVTEDLKGIVVYLPGYNMASAKLLVSGCDVWLNTPIVGFEACGTSGMKAALNGVLPCSTNDGWVAEADLYKLGWILKNENLSEDILEVLKNQIASLYYSRNKNGISENWIQMMKNARDMTLNQFSTTTMLRNYIEEFYLPIIKTHEAKL